MQQVSCERFIRGKGHRGCLWGIDRDGGRDNLAFLGGVAHANDKSCPGSQELAVNILVPFGCLGMCLVVNEVSLQTF